MERQLSSTYRRRTSPSWWAPSETWSAWSCYPLPKSSSWLAAPHFLSFFCVVVVGQFSRSFGELFRAAIFFFHQWQDAPQGGGRDRNFFTPWASCETSTGRKLDRSRQKTLRPVSKWTYHVENNVFCWDKMSPALLLPGRTGVETQSCVCVKFTLKGCLMKSWHGK